MKNKLQVVSKFIKQFIFRSVWEKMDPKDISIHKKLEIVKPDDNNTTGIYDSSDPDDIQQLPDCMIRIHSKWEDVEYGTFEIPLKVEIVGYLDGTTRINAVRFVHSKDEISFMNSLEVDSIIVNQQYKFEKMWDELESQFC